jgi:hypothetical protein
MGNNRPPDFLIISPHGSATTWLYNNLRFHPNIWLTPIKELDFFNADMLSFKKKRRRYVRNLRFRFSRITRKLVTLDTSLLRDLRWDGHFFLRRRTNDWYIKLFRPLAGQISGEATPTYALLRTEKIREIQRMNPDIKMIYLLRNPMDRSWSAAIKYSARIKKRLLSEVSDEEIYENLNSTRIVERTNHFKSLGNWETVFGPDQIFIDFFENVINEPKDLLLRIYEFLGVTTSEEFVSPKVREKINSAGKYKSAIPRRFQLHLARQQISHLRSLSQRFGDPASQWLKRAENILAIEEELN